MAPKRVGGSPSSEVGDEDIWLSSGGWNWVVDGSITLVPYHANLVKLVVTAIGLAVMVLLLVARLNIKTKGPCSNLNWKGFAMLKTAILLTTLTLAVTLTDDVLHQRKTTLSTFYWLIFTIWAATVTPGDILLISAIYTILNKHPSISPDGKGSFTFRAISYTTQAILTLLGVAVIALTAVVTAYNIKIHLFSTSKETFFEARACVSAAFFIVYFVLNLYFVVLAWIAFVKESKPRSKALLYNGIATSVLLVRSLVFLIFACVYVIRKLAYPANAVVVSAFVYALLTPTVCGFLVFVAFQPEWTGGSESTSQSPEPTSVDLYFIPPPQPIINSNQDVRLYDNWSGQPIPPDANSQNFAYMPQPQISPVTSEYHQQPYYGNAARPAPTGSAPWTPPNPKYQH